MALFEDKLIGSSYVLASLFTSALYIPCLIVMHRSPELNKLSCLRIMFHLGIFDLVYISSVTVCGIWSLTGSAEYISYRFNKSVMAITVGLGYSGYMITMTVLAFDRCVSMAASEYMQDMLFGYKRTTISQLWIIFCWFVGLSSMAFNLTDVTGVLYYPDKWAWHFDMNATQIAINKKTTLYTCILQQVIAWICNIVSIITVHKMTREMADSPQAEAAKKRERDLVLQTVLICASLFVSDQYFHNMKDWLCPSLGAYCYVVGLHLLILHSLTTPLIYFTINKTIKTKVKNMFAKNGTSARVKPGPKVKMGNKNVQAENNDE